MEELVIRNKNGDPVSPKVEVNTIVNLDDHIKQIVNQAIAAAIPAIIKQATEAIQSAANTAITTVQDKVDKVTDDLAKDDVVSLLSDVKSQVQVVNELKDRVKTLVPASEFDSYKSQVAQSIANCVKLTELDSKITSDNSLIMKKLKQYGFDINSGSSFETSWQPRIRRNLGFTEVANIDEGDTPKTLTDLTRKFRNSVGLQEGDTIQGVITLPYIKDKLGITSTNLEEFIKVKAPAANYEAIGDEMESRGFSKLTLEQVKDLDLAEFSNTTGNFAKKTDIPTTAKIRRAVYGDDVSSETLTFDDALSNNIGQYLPSPVQIHAVAQEQSVGCEKSWGDYQPSCTGEVKSGITVDSITGKVIPRKQIST